jgi:hypothetical protein
MVLPNAEQSSFVLLDVVDIAAFAGLTIGYAAADI